MFKPYSFKKIEFNLKLKLSDWKIVSIEFKRYLNVF